MAARDPEKNRACAMRRTRQRRSEAVAVLGSVCVRCGFDDIRALQIDHVRGNAGGKRRRSGYSMNNDIVNGVDRDKYQLLCANCNWIKMAENDERGGRPRVLDTPT